MPDSQHVNGENLRKKARKKFLSNSLAAGLARLDNSPLVSAYRKTFACCDLLAVSELGDLTSSYYCKNRWCMTCASIKMATMINKYLPAFQKLHNLYFVTLTLKTCAADEIPARIVYMQRQWRKIADLARRQNKRDGSHAGFIGLRKTELKIGRGGGYHGHYHIIVQGESNASFIVESWLRLNGNLASPKAQDMRAVTNTEVALLELFKYCTKCTAAENGGNQIMASFEQMDTIFRAIYRKRIYQPFGGMIGANEDDFELTPETVKRAAGIYKWIGHDWFHTDYGQTLTGWTPEQMEIAIGRK